MFSSASSKVEGFDPCWENISTPQDSCTQTGELIVTIDRDAQVKTSSNANTQTDENQFDVIDPYNVDYDKLADFLKRICPRVITELDKAIQSRGYTNNTSEVVNEHYEGKAHLLQKICVQNVVTNSEFKVNKVSSISWSATGNSIAFGFSSPEHESWCDHGSQVVYFSTALPGAPTNVPKRFLQTDSCVMCICAHPSEPAVFAVGMYNGEVLAWDLSKEDGEECTLGASARHLMGHVEAVSQVGWHRSLEPGQSGLQLVSAGRDGQMLFWQVNLLTATFQLGKGLAVSQEHGVHGRKPQTPAGGGLDNAMGITCYSFSPKEATTFVVGVEGGGILKCSTLTNKPTAVHAAIPLHDPVLSSYKGHQGSVTSVSFSPTLDETFISCGSDKEIHVYSLDQASPTRVIFTESVFIGIQWYPHNPSLFGAWGEVGTLEFFSFLKGRVVPALKIEHAGKQPIAALSFNPIYTNQVAFGDIKGKAAVWQMLSPRAYNDAEEL